MKKIIGLLAIAAMGVTLTACGEQSSQSSDNASQSSSQTSQAVTNNDSSSQQAMSSSSSSHHDDTLWNSSKDAQLTSFINKWAPTMGQSYEKYDGQSQLKTVTGISYPESLSNELVNGQSGLIGWAPTGEGDYEYNVVAIYNYDNPEPPAARITYFFAFHNGKPVVLVDQSNNGDPDCKPTSNQDVASAFERIANE
jgi:hypothetical protein